MARDDDDKETIETEEVLQAEREEIESDQQLQENEEEVEPEPWRLDPKLMTTVNTPTKKRQTSPYWKSVLIYGAYEHKAHRRASEAI